VVAALHGHYGERLSRVLRFGNRSTTPNARHPERSGASAASGTQSRDLTNDPKASAVIPRAGIIHGVPPLRCAPVGMTRIFCRASPLKFARHFSQAFASLFNQPQTILVTPTKRCQQSTLA
jgi:hypothetical protein